MLDQCQKFPRNQLYVNCHVHSRHENAEDKEFGFWSAWEFQTQAHLEEDLGVHSPRLWETNIKYESSPLLSQNHHHYSDLSPTSRRRVILEGRSELMQMIQDMPESCYELSLKDIVDEEQQGVQKAGEGTDVEEKTFDLNAQARIRKQKKTTYKTRQISRTSSMESETFLIKMFFPTFIGLKKKAKAAGNCSKVPPRPTFKGPENHEDLCDENTSSRRRFFEEDTLPGCWTFFHSKKGKSKRPRGS